MSTNAQAKQRAALEMYVGSDLPMRAVGAYLGMAVSHVHYAIHAEAARRGMRIVTTTRRELRPLTTNGSGETSGGNGVKERAA